MILYWQGIIGISIIGAFYFGGKKLGVGISAFWIIHTLIVIHANWLMSLQLMTIGITLWVGVFFVSQMREKNVGRKNEIALKEVKTNGLNIEQMEKQIALMEESFNELKMSLSDLSHENRILLERIESFKLEEMERKRARKNMSLWQRLKSNFQ